MSTSAAEMDNCCSKAKSSLITSQLQMGLKVSDELEAKTDHMLARQYGPTGAVRAGHMTYRLRKEGLRSRAEAGACSRSSQKGSTRTKNSSCTLHFCALTVKSPFNWEEVSYAAALQNGTKHEGSMTSDELELLFIKNKISLSGD